jgi:hypothetical protein
MTEFEAEKLGSQAYRDGEMLSENPFDKNKDPALHKVWADSWKHEREYWEFRED